MVLTRMPCRARSRAIGNVMPTTPPFDAEYGVCPIWPSKAAADAVFRIAPREVPADDAARAAQAGAVDEDPEGPEFGRRLDRGLHLLLVGDVGLGEHTADLGGELLARRLLQVEHDHSGAALRQEPRRGLTEARCATGHDRRCTCDVHASLLLFGTAGRAMHRDTGLPVCFGAHPTSHPPFHRRVAGTQGPRMVLSQPRSR